MPGWKYASPVKAGARDVTVSFVKQYYETDRNPPAGRTWLRSLR